MKPKQLIMVASIAAFSSLAMANEQKSESGWLMNADHSLTFQFPGECTDKELASLPRWKTIQCRGTGTGLTVCQDKILTISIDSQNAYCRVDVKPTADIKEGVPPNLPPGCYLIRHWHCTVCNPSNIAEGCGAGYTPADLNAWEREEAAIFGWEHVRKLEGKDK